ncbi:Odorant receptor 33c like [Melia azedarach]|uniref:Odorant receptor 33c like n=1 Tax=Melia azedarach TaxID=155640 RepID=A0ACC1YZ62_MELAZ|nr:Odorant receptor 33c like [Melia azedarach]
MGGVTCEKGVLKLVHPGRYMEIRKEPVIAAEVMEKNPRHCITRPDVFKYPWIVVKPESVLNLGRVFYIVPNRTIYHLLKTRGSPDQLSRQTHSPFMKGTSPLKSYAGMTPKHLKENNQFLDQLLQTAMDSWPQLTVKNNRTSLEYEESSTDSIRSFNARDFYHSYSSDSNMSWKFSEREDEYISWKIYETEDKDITKFDDQNSKQVTISKSCLRKERSL